TVTLSLAGSPLAEAGGVATLTATLSAPTSQDVAVSLAFTGSAANPADYRRSADSLLIRAGQTSASLTLTGVDDALAEGPETTAVDISAVANAVELGNQQATATIPDDDTAPVRPTVIRVDPRANATTAPTTTSVSATFDQEIDPASVAGPGQ